MSNQGQIVLSQENIDLLASLAESLGGAEEVRKDPNFVLSLLLNRMRERPSGDIVGLRLDTLGANSIEYARKKIARKKNAA